MRCVRGLRIPIVKSNATANGYPSTPISLLNLGGMDGTNPIASLLADAPAISSVPRPSANRVTIVRCSNSAPPAAIDRSAIATFPNAVAVNGNFGQAETARVTLSTAVKSRLSYPDGGSYSPASGTYSGGAAAVTNALAGLASRPAAPGQTATASFNLTKTDISGTDGTATDTATATPTPALTTLVVFNDTDGAIPEAGLIADASGNLFGTTTDGGAYGRGTVFEIPRTIAGYANVPITLVSFNNSNGADPWAPLIANAAGDLFGTTSANGVDGHGTVFEIAKTRTGYARTPITLVSFSGTDGQFPYSSLIADAAGNLFGMTEDTVFELVKDRGHSYTLITLTSSIGAAPFSEASLIADTNGNLFGINSGGIVFEIEKIGTRYASTPTTLASLPASAQPKGGLTADARGDLFGTTSHGGAYADGSVFELKNTGGGHYTLTTLISFNGTDGGGPDAGGPNGGLIMDAAGNLFGTTLEGGGSFDDGEVFELAKSGGGYARTPIILTSFSPPNPEASPVSSLLADAAGNLFGATYTGGSGDGTIYELAGTGFHVMLLPPSGLALASSSDSGVKGDRITNVATPTITGKGVAGEKVTLHDGGKVIGTAVVGRGGAWSVTPASALAVGVHSLTATESGKTGTSDASTALNLTIKTSAAAPSGLGFAVKADEGSAGDTFRVSGKGEAGDRVTLFDGKIAIGSGKVGAGGVWSITTAKALAVGAHSLSVGETDVAGNLSGRSPAERLVVAHAAANSVTFFGSSSIDKFTGGAGNDVFRFSAVDLGNTDIVKGGGGHDQLVLTSAGAVRTKGVSGVETYRLANGAGNVVTLAAANFAGVLGGAITVAGGKGADRLSAAGLSAGDHAALNGGAGKDTLVAGRNAALTGGPGADVFVLTVPGSRTASDKNTIADFAHGVDKLALREKGFALGASPHAATLFTADSTGSFTNPNQRFAYDTTHGRLFYDARGDSAGSTRLEIAALTNRPTLTASDITFVA
jgi:uncharacterized repeat protein (TIGR03803 family)